MTHLQGVIYGLLAAGVVLGVVLRIRRKRHQLAAEAGRKGGEAPHAGRERE